MASGTYSGAWKRATLPISRLPLKPGIDPEHSQPSDKPDESYDTSYVDMTGGPLLPDSWAGGQLVQPWVPSEFSDQTPVTHSDGVGFLPGVTREQAQLVGGYARSQDLGAPDVRDFERPAYQGDGSTHVEIVNGDLAGESPATIVLQEKGIGTANDPYARHNRAIRRRPTGPATYDMRWFDQAYRPRYLHTAQGSKERPMVANRQENTPDSARGAIARPDNWATPILRRVAPSWDQPYTADAVDDSNGGNFGLTTWGL